MGKVYEGITPELAAWVAKQAVFFVGTAPRSADGHVNVSPKGLDTLRILEPRRIAYLDLTGSGAETIGYGVPAFGEAKQREALDMWTQKRGAAGLAAYRQQKNARSIDGLPAFEPEDEPAS